MTTMANVTGANTTFQPPFVRFFHVSLFVFHPYSPRHSAKPSQQNPKSPPSTTLQTISANPAIQPLYARLLSSSLSFSATLQHASLSPPSHSKRENTAFLSSLLQRPKAPIQQPNINTLAFTSRFQLSTHTHLSPLRRHS